MRIKLKYEDNTEKQIDFDGTLEIAVQQFLLAPDHKCMEIEIVDAVYEKEFGGLWRIQSIFYPSQEMIAKFSPYYRLYIKKIWISGDCPGNRELVCGYLK